MSKVKSTKNEPSSPINDHSNKIETEEDAGQPNPSEQDPNTASRLHSAPTDWDAAFDPASNAWYYYNLVTGERSWDPPPGWVPNSEGVADALPSEDAPQLSRKYYYKDVNGETQGPFSIEQLNSFRGYLPVDLVLWWGDGKPSEQSKTTLARVLGDTNLVNPFKSSSADCGTSTKVDGHQDTERIAKYENEHHLSFASLAEAAFAGLPSSHTVFTNNDDQVQGNQSDEYAAIALRASGLGRVRTVTGEAGEGADGGLYSDMGSWVDPSTVQKQLSIAKEARQKRSRGLGRNEVQAIKQRKREMKEKKLKSWLLSD